MTDNLDQRALSQLTEEERQLLAEDSTLLEDALASKHETVQARAARDEPDPEHELRRDPTPAFDIPVPADAAERLAVLAEQKARIIESFNEGDITAREYADALEAIDDRREDVRGRQRWAKTAREMQERALDSAWNSEVERFLAGAGKDIMARGEPALVAFDSYVKKVTGDAANSRLSDKAQLAKAHKLFLADFGGTFGGDQVNARAGGGRTDFAALDRLAESNPREFERRVAGMTDDEREEYGL